MINQHTTSASLRQVRLYALACRTLCARMLMLFVFIVACSASYSTTALADGTQRSRAEAVEIAKQRSGDGRVLSVKKKLNKDGVSVYAVKIITNGRVKVYTIREFSN